MKVAYVVSRYPAISHTFIRREIAALRRRGVDVDTFSIRRGEARSDADRRELETTFVVLDRASGVAVSVVRTFVRRPWRWTKALGATLRERLHGPGGLLRACAYFAEGMHLASEIERRGVARVHNHFVNPAAAAGLAAARYLGLPWSCTVHGLSDLAGPTTVLLPARAEAAAFVASATHYGRAQVLRVVPPALWDRVHVVRCGIEPATIPRVASRRVGRAGEPLRILCVGRLAPEKGHLGLLAAFHAVVEAGIEARLTILGDGPERARIEAEIRARGLDDRVELPGAASEEEVFAAMSRSDVFAMSSLMEGLPVVLMEALATELAVVAPAVGGIPELVGHGETGLLYEAAHWPALGERLITLARDPELRERLGRAGRKRVLADFDVDRCVEPLAVLFGAPSSGATARPALASHS